tara:strand:- start:23 stop:994 length:972 start_codon:yes stop_codon:yes gene_type:complete
MANYITKRDLYDIYPNIGEYDSKNVIYGWKVDSGSRYKAENCGLVTVLFVDGQKLGSAQTGKSAVDAAGEWYYDATSDVVYYFNSSTNPQNLLMEAGEDSDTFKSRMISNATEYFNSKVDSTLPREMFVKEDGTYDYFIKRTVGLFAVSFMIKAYEPESEIAETLLEEAETNILDLNEGRVKLDFQTSGDMSQGEISKVSVSGALNIVDTRGDYSGTYDKIKVVITNAGAIGTSKYSVYVKDSDSLKSKIVVTDKIINGDYQELSGGLQIRFSGPADNSSATLHDEWEIEVAGVLEHTDSASVRTIKLTRNSKKRRRYSFFKN